MTMILPISTNNCPRCGGRHIDMRVREGLNGVGFVSDCPHTNEIINITIKVETS